MNLQFYKWNNYYNRTYKPFSLTEASNALVGSILNVNNFNPNDGVDTEQMTGLNTFTEIPDYCIVLEGTEIISKWFVIECQRTRQGQYKLSLHRDLISDYYQEITEAPVFIEKGWLPYNSPLIFNRENMTFNKVKKAEILLKEKYPCVWLVAYVAPNADNISGSAVTTDTTYDIDVPNQGNISTWEYWKYCQGNPNRENLYSNTYNHLFHVYEVESSGSGNPFKKESFRYNFNETSPQGSSYVDFQDTTCKGLTMLKLRTHYDTYSSSINEQVNGQVGTKSTLYMNNINDLSGKIIRYYSGGYRYAIINVLSKTEHIGETYVSAGALYNNMKTWVEASGGKNVNEKTLSFETDVTSYSIQLTDITQSISATFTLTKDKQRLVDAPYYMVCMPYGNFTLHITVNGEMWNLPYTKDLAMDMMNSFVSNGQTNIYDFQLLPYCPISGLDANVDESSADIYVDNYTTASVIQAKDSEGILKAIVFLASYSKFSTQINMSSNIAYDYLTKIVKNPIERKVKNECELIRIASPNGSNSFDFSPQLNDGFDYIQVDCTYKPYSPYIRVAPDFAGLYGDNFGDTRGLIVQGDFSLPVITDQWKQYEINNKNYANVFDRETKSLELKEHYQRIQQGWSIAAGAVGSAGAGAAFGAAGGPIGMVAGAAIGAGLSVGGGIADYNISKKLYEENMSYRQDMYSMSLENIQARPNGLAKTSAFTNNNKIYPFIEVYSATDTEKEALRSKILYNGMTVGVIGKITDYIGSKVGSESHHYVKGQLIQIDVSDDYHTCQAINNEINMGIRFPV